MTTSSGSDFDAGRREGARLALRSVLGRGPSEAEVYAVLLPTDQPNPLGIRAVTYAIAMEKAP